MHSRAATSSFSTISSIVTILFIICLSSRACCGAPTQKQQQPQQQEQLQQLPHHSKQHLQQEQPVALVAPTVEPTEAQPNQNAELLRQLLTLAGQNQQQQQQQTGDAQGEPKFVVNVDDGNSMAESKKQQLAALYEAKLAAENARQKRFAVKRKLHKLVDDIIDESPATTGGDAPLNKRRSLAQNQQVQQQDKDDVFMDKRRPLSDGNELGDLLVSQAQPAASSQAQQPARRLPNLSEHTRNILDDSFGIRRDSVFTANNHLGMKGVPKFGSDEQF